MNKKVFRCFKAAIKFYKERQMDIIYVITTLYNFIIIDLSKEEKNI